MSGRSADGSEAGPGGTEPLLAPSGPKAQPLVNAPTVVDTRPSAGAALQPLESARTALVTPFESAGTAMLPSALETARTTAATEGAVESTDGIALRPFGPYTRIETLGHQGNMGVVARGYNHAFGRWELLKFLKPALSHDAELLRQFRREGRALARLSHPNVVQVFAMYDLDAQPCIAMEFLEGLSLSAELERAGGRLSQDRAQELLLDAARGLAAAHELGLLHRDIKPDNLFVTLPGKGRVAGLKLIDFGLATADKARPEELQKDPSLASDATGGTPLFLAPEIWQGRDPTPLTDLYALGVSFYFALAGHYPFKDTGLHAVISYCASPEPPPSVSVERPELAPAFAALINRLVDKDPSKRLESADKLVAELALQRASQRVRRVPGAGPYRGLLAYSESERDVFFGREREIAEITERLRTQQGLLLVGPVACGKSSLARAGVVPALRDGVLGGGHTFEAVVLEPRGQPLKALTAALSPLLQTPEVELSRELAAAPGELRSLIERKLAPERGLVVVVDQLEELSLVPGTEAARFARALESLLEVESPRLRLVATVRSDVVDRLFALSSLRGLLTRGFHPVGPLSDEQLAQALREPAVTAGYSFENPQIFEEIVQTVRGATAALPLASLALARLYQARDESQRCLTHLAWSKLGGVVGALIEHADAVWQSLGASERAAAGDVVLRLISSQGQRGSARREALVDPAGGGEAARQALERLLQARLCIEVAGEVELVHDALVSSWPLAKKLLASVGVDQQLRQRVSQAASQWEEQNKPSGLLWSGEQAERLLVWFQSAEQSFTLTELAFVEAVRRQAKRGRRVRRTGLIAATLAGLAAVAWLSGRERLLSSELERLREKSAQAAEQHRQEAGKLYKDRAQMRLLDDPSGALSDAQAAARLVATPALDTIAWQALALGVPFALPPHQGGAGFIASDGEYVVTSGTDALHSLRLQGPGSGKVDLPHGHDGRPLSISALALAGDAWLGTVDGQVLRAGYTLAEAQPTAAMQSLTLTRVGSAPGGVRDIIAREKRGRAFAVFSNAGELALYAAESGSLKPLWHGAARDVALDRDGAQLAVANANGDVSLLLLPATDPQAPPHEQHPTDAGKPATLATHTDATAVTWLGGQVVEGDEEGHLLRFGAAREPQRAATTLGGPVRRLLVSRNEQCLVAQGGAGLAAVFGPDLVERARLRVGTPAVRFMDAWRAVALVDEHQAVVVLGCDTGQELARFRRAGDWVTGLGSADAWIFSAALDGGVRAFSLTGSLPRPQPPVAGATQTAVSASGLLAALAPGAVELAASQAGNGERATLGKDQTAGAAALLSVGAGVAWARGSAAFAFWDRKQVTTGETERPLQLLYARPNSPELLLAVEGAVPGTSELRRVRHGSAEQATSALASRPLALAQIADGPGLAVLSASGPLRLLSDVGGAQNGEVALPAGDHSGALALTADGARFAVGYVAGGVSVGSLRTPQAAAQALPLGRSAVTCVAFGRDERVLLVGDEHGQVSALDLDTKRAFPLFTSTNGPITCGYDAARERFTLLDGAGHAWTRALDTTPLSFLPAVEDPLDSKAHSIGHWGGLEPGQALAGGHAR